MNNIGLYLNITKFKSFYETIPYFLIVPTIEIAKQEILKILSTYFKVLNIDYPLEFHEFEFIWFNQQYINVSAFSYKLFINNKWEEPWELQELYNDILEIMHDEEIKLINESVQDDEEDENEPKDIIDPELKQHVEFEEDTVKECFCAKCQDR